MLPTLSHTGDFVLISPIPIRLHSSSSSPSTPQSHDRQSTSAARWGSSWGINRGDIIVATSPTDPSKTVCKRVLGLEGDVIEVDPIRTKNRREAGKGEGVGPEKRWEEVDAEHREAVRRKNQSQKVKGEEKEILVPVFPTTAVGSTASHSDHVRIPKGYVYLVGDNESNSTDSRAYGPVPLAMVKGKVLARVKCLQVFVVVYECSLMVFFVLVGLAES